MVRIQTLAAALLLLSCVSSVSAQKLPPDDLDLRCLQVSEGVVQLFRQLPDSVWPGYDLANTPFVVYRPGKWALLLGYLTDVADFAAYPANWPDLGHPVRFHRGQYENLIGQIEFDFPIGDTTTVAVGLPDATPDMPGLEDVSLEEYTFGFIVHEAFHQYQYEAFGEIPWEREERYPILNVKNTALAALEMRLLDGALTAASAGDAGKCGALTRMFAAVRKQRWGSSPDFVRRFEQGLELSEGTAKYVEVRALDLVKRLRYHSDVPVRPSLAGKMRNVTAAGLVQMDFRGSFTDKSVSPEDMPRNRVYPVAAAQCLLLDYFGVNWKEAAQQGGDGFTMVDLLADRLTVGADSLQGLFARACAWGGLDEIEQATSSLVEVYLSDCQQALETFEAQPGYRIEIKTKRSGVSRSRVTSQRKWLMDDGRRQLCLEYDAYSLGSDDLTLQVQDSGLLEENDWEAGIRTVAVYVDEHPEIKLDGEPLVTERNASAPPDRGGMAQPAAKTDFSRRFKEIELSAGGLFLRCSLPGSITRTGDRIAIDLAGG